MNRILIFTITLFLLSIITCFADEFTIDGITYEATSYNTVTVSGYTNEIPEIVNIPDSVEHESISYKVTEISKLSRCDNLKKIIIPNSVTIIHSDAFRDCKNISCIYIHKNIKIIGERCFAGCVNLSSIKVDKDNTTYDSREQCNAVIETKTNKLIAGCKETIIPPSVKIIGAYAFWDQFSLTHIDIPNSVTTIQQESFYGCENLSSINMTNNITHVGFDAFGGTKWVENQPNGCIYIGKTLYKYKHKLVSDTTLTKTTPVKIRKGTISICPYAFSISDLYNNRYESISVELPNSIKRIGASAFDGCSTLKSINIPKNIKTIEEHTFFYCTNLTNIEIPNNVMVIREMAFAECTSLTSVKIPDSVIHIEKFAFSGCNNLSAISVSQSNPVYDSRENCNAIIETTTNTLISGCKSTVIPQSVTSIGSGAFAGCSGLTSVDISNNITNIGKWAFNRCDNLTHVEIPNSVEEIGHDAFSYCTKLVSVQIGAPRIEADVHRDCARLASYHMPVNIGIEAFSYCENLKEATFIGSTMIKEKSFSNCKSLTTIFIPDGSNIGESAFESCTNLKQVWIGGKCTIEANAFTHCDNLTSVHAPTKTIVKVERAAFANTGIKSIIETGYKIKDWTYASCKNLTSVKISDYVYIIGEHSFEDCENLTSVIISKNVKAINFCAFNKCPKLKSIKCEATVPPSICVYLGISNKSTTVYVPSSSVEAYKTDRIWGQYDIQCIDEDDTADKI